jgi:hypothetical protein
MKRIIISEQVYNLLESAEKKGRYYYALDIMLDFFKSKYNISTFFDRNVGGKSADESIFDEDRELGFINFLISTSGKPMGLNICKKISEFSELLLKVNLPEYFATEPVSHDIGDSTEMRQHKWREREAELLRKAKLIKANFDVVMQQILPFVYEFAEEFDSSYMRTLYLYNEIYKDYKKATIEKQRLFRVWSIVKNTVFMSSEQGKSAWSLVDEKELARIILTEKFPDKTIDYVLSKIGIKTRGYKFQHLFTLPAEKHLAELDRIGKATGLDERALANLVILLRGL